MQKNLYNLKNPQKEISEHDTKKVFKWILIVLVIIAVGFLIYKKFVGRQPSLEEKLDVLNSLQSEDDGVTREEKEKALDEMATDSSAETYTEQQKLDALNNL